jgi:hypothetical protein
MQLSSRLGIVAGVAMLSWGRFSQHSSEPHFWRQQAWSQHEPLAHFCSHGVCPLAGQLGQAWQHFGPQTLAVRIRS